MLKSTIGRYTAVAAICLSILTILGCSNHDVESSSSKYRFGNIVVERTHLLLTDADLITAVSNAFDNYTLAPDVQNCTDLAYWFRDGLEAVLEGNLVRLIQSDMTLTIGEQILPPVVGVFSQALVETLQLNPSVCTRESYIASVETLPEPGPIALEARTLLLERGGDKSVSPSAHLDSAVNVVEGVPIVVELHGFDNLDVDDGTKSFTDWIPFF